MKRTQYEDPPQVSTFVDTTWDVQEDTAIVPVRRNNNFVPAPRVTQVTAVQPLTEFNVQSPAQSLVKLDTSYEDRARGFVWVSLPLAAITGVLSCVAGVVLFQTPVLSFGILTWFLTAFCLTWVTAWALHLFMSPDGALVWSSWALWRTVGKEQSHRHQVYWRQYEDSRRDAGLDVRPASRRRR